MPSLRRATALLSGLLLLQLTLLGADWPCGAHGRSRERAATAGSGAHAQQHRSHAPEGTCDAAQTAGDCARMPSCAGQLSVPARLATAVAPAPASDELPEPVSIQSQPASGPDVPPPRG